jgi:hypothetical protein
MSANRNLQAGCPVEALEQALRAPKIAHWHSPAHKPASPCCAGVCGFRAAKGLRQIAALLHTRTHMHMSTRTRTHAQTSTRTRDLYPTFMCASMNSDAVSTRGASSCAAHSLLQAALGTRRAPNDSSACDRQRSPVPKKARA